MRRREGRAGPASRRGVAGMTRANPRHPMTNAESSMTSEWPTRDREWSGAPGDGWRASRRTSRD